MKILSNFKLTISLFLLISTGNLFSQTDSETQKIQSESNLQILNELKNQFEINFQRNQIEIANYVVQMNVPKKYTDANGTLYEIQKILADGTPLYYQTHNIDAAKSTRTNFLHSGGGMGLNLMGTNMKAFIWDGGHSLATHQEFSQNGESRITNMDLVDEGGLQLDSHANHVTGTILAAGVNPQAKGMAPQAKAYNYKWNNDLTEATIEAFNGMLVSNHSYGYRTINPNTNEPALPNYYPGAYITDSKNWDQLLYNAPYYLMINSAGNDGTRFITYSPLEGNTGYDKLVGSKTAKNNLVIANANDAVVDANGNLISVTINTGSSQGPTDDYRIKPDLTGNGTDLLSANSTSTNAYIGMTGTSMASPNIAGSILPLQEHAKNVNGTFYRASTIKGLALHTADDFGPIGPDAISGWGLMNSKKAAETILNNGTSAKIKEVILQNGQTFTMTVTSNEIESLFASISWTDPAAEETTHLNDTTPRLVNDLDLRISKGGNTFYPWLLTGVTTNAKGDNFRDPFERVEVANPSGEYTITVSHKGNLTNQTQVFSLIITGIEIESSNCQLLVPTNLIANSISSSTASIYWDEVDNATYEVQYKKMDEQDWISNETSNSTFFISELIPSTHYQVRVRSKCGDSSFSEYSELLNFSTTEEILFYCSSSSNSFSDEYIERVQLNTIDNPSGGSYYSDFTHINTELTKDHEYTITITPKWTGMSFSEGYAVWIDFNKNGEFDEDERVFSKQPSTQNPVYGTFLVPGDAILGETRMRVSLAYEQIPPPCGYFTYGEVEDYTVIIQGNVLPDEEPPTAPQNLNVSDITTHSLNLNWEASTDNVGVSGYDIFMDEIQIGTTTELTYAVTELEENSTYIFYVKAKDEAGNFSEISNLVEATTLSIGIEYCISMGESSQNEWIKRVDFADMSNVSGNDGGYGDFTNLTAQVAKNQSYFLSIHGDFILNQPHKIFGAWIDYNQNGIFESSEFVFDWALSSTTRSTAKVTIPNDALSGETRMRVAMKRSGVPSPCEIFPYGEVEDYTIIIGAAGRENMQNEASIFDAWSLYPNPVGNDLFIKTEADIISLKIIDLNGKEVLTSHPTQKLNVSILNPGIYLLSIETNQGFMTKKIIKK